MYEVYAYTVYIKSVSTWTEKYWCCLQVKWSEAGGIALLLCAYLGLVSFVLLPLRKSVRTYIREKNPLNFLSGSHNGYMIKKECISLSRLWLAWPGEMLGPVIPWELDKLWSGVWTFSYASTLFWSDAPFVCCCFDVILHKSLNFSSSSVFYSVKYRKCSFIPAWQG